MAEGRRKERQKVIKKETGGLLIGPGHVGSKSLEAHLTAQQCMQMFAVLSRDRQMHSCSITLDTDPLNPEIDKKKKKTDPENNWTCRCISVDRKEDISFTLDVKNVSMCELMWFNLFVKT